MHAPMSMSAVVASGMIGSAMVPPNINGVTSSPITVMDLEAGNTHDVAVALNGAGNVVGFDEMGGNGFGELAGIGVGEMAGISASALSLSSGTMLVAQATGIVDFLVGVGCLICFSMKILFTPPSISVATVRYVSPFSMLHTGSAVDGLKTDTFPFVSL